MASAILFVLIYHSAGLFVGLFAHELGHAVAAWLIGYRPRVMRVGGGWPLFRKKLGSLWIVIHMLPIYGWVSALDAGRSKGLDAHFTIAGPAANLGLFLIGLLVLNAAPDLEAYVVPLVLAQVPFLIGSLYPTHLTIEGQKLPSDGLSLLQLLVAKKSRFDEFADLIAPYATDGASAGRLRAHATEIAYQNRRGASPEPWARLDAATVLRDFPNLQHMPDAEKAFVLAFVALYQLLFSPAIIDRQSMDWSSAWAVALVPTPQARIIRGGVLVELGCPRLALDLLMPLVSLPLAPTYRALCRALIGQAMIALDDESAAETWFDEARSFPEAAKGILPAALADLSVKAAKRAAVDDVIDAFVLKTGSGKS